MPADQRAFLVQPTKTRERERRELVFTLQPVPPIYFVAHPRRRWVPSYLTHRRMAPADATEPYAKQYPRDKPVLAVILRCGERSCLIAGHI
jgi:hypothetical protein